MPPRPASSITPFNLDLDAQLDIALAHVSVCREELADVARDRVDILQALGSNWVPLKKSPITARLDLELQTASDRYTEAHEVVDAIIARQAEKDAQGPGVV